jgi:pentatricopeptide repeat protein
MKMPRLEYSKTSEIPAALGRLSPEELASVVEARLRGESAGLPAPDREEDPGAILQYAFAQGDAAFREKLKHALAQILERNLRSLALAESPELNGRRSLLEGVFFLIGQTGDRQALPVVRRFLPVAEFLDGSLVQRLLGCIAALAGPEDTALVPWLLEKATAAEYSRIALRGLYRIHRPSAAAALPTVAMSLLGRQQEAPSLLARMLALLLPSLPETEQVEFIRQIGSSLRILDSPGVSQILAEALNRTPGMNPRAIRLAQFWTLRRAVGLPPVVREEPSTGPPFPQDRARRKVTRTAEQKLQAALAHVTRMEKLLEKLKNRKYDPADILRKIDQQITFVEKSQGKEPENASYYARTLTQLGTRLVGAGLLEQAKLCLGKAREAAPQDPYPVSLEIVIKAREGNLVEAEEVFAGAKEAGLLDRVTYNALLDAYGKAGNLAKAEAVFAEAEEAGLVDEVTYSALLDAYGKAGNLAKAEELFAEAAAAGLLSGATYSALLDAYGKAGNLSKVEALFAEAEEVGVLDEVTYGAVLDAYGKAGNLAKAEAVFAEAKGAGLLDEATYSALLDAYGKAGNLARAEEVFAEAMQAGLVSRVAHTALLDAYGKAGNLAKAEAVFAQAREAGSLDEVIYGALLDAYGKAGNLAKVEEVFEEARDAGLVSGVTYTALLDAYGKAGSLAKAEEVFGEAKEAGLLNEATYGALLDAYGKAGNLAEAQAVFAEAEESRLLSGATYNALLDAYARAGRIDRLLAAFDQAMKSGITFSAYDKKVVAGILLKGMRTGGRQDEIFEVLPRDFLGEEILLFYGKIHPNPAEALRRLKGAAEQSIAAQLVCRYRLAAKHPLARYQALQDVREEMEERLESPGSLSGLAQVHIANALSRCWSRVEKWQATYETWERIATATLPRGPRVTFLAGHGRDSVVWGLHSHEDPAAVHALVSGGTREVLQGLSLEQGSDLRSPDASIAYGDVVAAMKQVRLGIEVLAPAERREAVELLRSASPAWDWHAALEGLPEVGPDEFNEVRAGRQAAIELLQMAV